jgi:hypothetical protein
MWQSEALWLGFHSLHLLDRQTGYPFAIKVATGKINAITGENWHAGLSRSPQDYLVAPTQPWLDGYCVQKGVIRQFVAMPLGEGYSVEEQLTGEAKFGGMQLEVFPMRAEAFEKHFPIVRGGGLFETHWGGMSFCKMAGGMGLAPGGRMRQEIYADPYSIDDWDSEHSSRCFVHLVNSAGWQEITGEPPSALPFTAEQYTSAGYPWFDYHDAEMKALKGANSLAGLKSVKQKGEEKRAAPLPENQSVSVTNVVELRAGLSSHQVRESDLN